MRVIRGYEAPEPGCLPFIGRFQVNVNGDAPEVEGLLITPQYSLDVAVELLFVLDHLSATDSGLKSAAAQLFVISQGKSTPGKRDILPRFTTLMNISLESEARATQT